MQKRWKIALQRVPRQDRAQRQVCPHCGRRLRLTLPEMAEHKRACREMRSGERAAEGEAPVACRLPQPVDGATTVTWGHYDVGDVTIIGGMGHQVFTTTSAWGR